MLKGMILITEYEDDLIVKLIFPRPMQLDEFRAYVT